MFKKAGLVVFIIFIISQFYRPNKNIQETPTLNDFLISEKAPKDIRELFKNSCYDCHSDRTNYLWFDNIAPASWYVDGHIKNGKKQLNFSTWRGYNNKSKKDLLSQIASNILEERMPLSSYTLIHRNAKLSKEEKDKVIAWLFTL